MSMTDKVSTMVILKNSTSSESDCLQSLSKKPGSLQQDYIFPTHDIDKTISSPHSPNRLHFEIQPETSQMEAIFTTNSSIESITSEYKKDLCIELHTTEKKTSECLQSHPISIFEHKSHPKDFEINPPLNDVNEERERQKEKERERNRRKEREREREKEKEKQKEKEKELRERNRERDRGRDREREKKREREKDRERAREREQEREYRYQREKERERQRKKEKEDERDRERERDPDRGRDSSAYRSSRYSSLDRSFRSDRGRTRHRSTSRDRSYIETESPKSPSRISSSARSSSISDLPQHERDKRTVFVAQLHAEARQREIRDFFEKHGTGPVRDVKLIADKGSRRMKGLGYIEFMEEDSVEKAIELTGQVFMGIPIIVQRTEAEKNRAAEAATVHVTCLQTECTSFSLIYTRDFIFA
ncbi:hypothetical protein HMI56_003718 [Coelomomyces lativittatus]|nr:hypothetical protein HMI56_003718 [Coelomomyces lativittatus]